MNRATLARQLLGVMRLEWRRQLLNWRAIWLAVWALFPVAIFVTAAVLHAKFAESGGPPDMAELREGFANVYHGLIVRLVVFFGCMSLFLGLVRGEVEQRSLHYLFLAPVRRSVVVAGKYLAALSIAWTFFVGCTVLCLVTIYSQIGLGKLLSGVGFRELVSYSAMTALACVGYGAIFLAVGTLLRGPGLVVAILFVWEWFHFLLPPVLKQLSVVHYIRELTPVPISEGPFALLSEPTPAWLATGQLLLYAAFFAGVAIVWVSRMEINYSR